MGHPDFLFCWPTPSGDGDSEWRQGQCSNLEIGPGMEIYWSERHAKAEIEKSREGLESLYARVRELEKALQESSRLVYAANAILSSVQDPY